MPSELSKALSSRPFQKEGALFAMRNRNVLIADEPGLGKTIQAIGAVVGSKISGTILVISPKTAMYVTWPAELARWLDGVPGYDVVRVLGGKLSKRERYQLMQKIIQWDIDHSEVVARNAMPYPMRQWVLVSPNYLRFKYQLDEHGNYIYENGEKVIHAVNEALTSLLAIRYSAVIVDEAHLTLAGATGNLKKQSAQSRGIRMLDIRDDGLRLALSGSPFRGKHENLWGILNWIDPNYTPYWDWIKRHFNIYTDYGFGGDIVGELKDEKKLAQDCARYMIRRTKKQVLPELPSKQYGGTPLPNSSGPNRPVAVWLPMDGVQRKAYEQMQKQAMADVEGGTLMANSILAELTRLKQFANSYGYLDSNDQFQPGLPSNKFDWILEFLRERGIDGPEPSGNRVVIASQFTRHINLFAQELREHYKINCFVLTGQTNEDERVRYQREFQKGITDSGNPSAEVFLLNTHAGGVSLTLDAADDIVIVDSTYNSDDQLQVEDRCHRISRVHNLTVWNLVTKDSIDERILRDTWVTGKSLRRILDKGGAEAARRLIQ